MWSFNVSQQKIHGIVSDEESPLSVSESTFDKFQGSGASEQRIGTVLKVVA